MSSQENLLDELLKDISEEDEQTGQEMSSPDIDAVAEMSEAEIAKRLEKGMGGAPGQKKDSSQGDVLDILGDTEDDDLQDIRDMLKKSDRNETIDRGIMDSEEDNGPGLAVKLQTDIKEAGEKKVAGSSKKLRAMKKKLEKEEKAAQKRAAKEAAKAEKEARRNQKKKQKKKGSQQEEESDIFQGSESNEIREFDMSRDLDILDSIVSGAEHVERRATERHDSDMSDNSLKSDNADSADSADSLLAFAQKDLDRGEREAVESMNQDVVTLDLEEADAYIPDISKTENADGEKAEKKEGLLSKLVNILTEEEEEPENENIPLSEENEGIIQDLDSEEAKKSSGSKKKPKKAKKAKKKKEAKPKKAKPAKPKKVKKPKEAEPYVPGSRLTFKKMLPVLLLGITVGAVVFLFVNLVTGYSVKQEALAAYNKGDYQTCYIYLYGRDLNETEAMMYGKSESILYAQLLRQEYELTAENGTDVEALDRLIQIVDRYPALYNYAAQWNATGEVQDVYNEMLGILYENYGITEEQAQEVAAIKSDIEYTRAVTALAEGRAFGSWNTVVLPQPPETDTAPDAQEEAPAEEPPQQDVVESDDLGDELPEEAELEDGNFVDNQQ